MSPALPARSRTVADLARACTLACALALSALAALVLAGCSASSVPGIYRIDVQQGNVVDQEMLDQLQPGMDRRKVRFLLGTPLIADTFNQNRWDYLYTFKEGAGRRDQRRISLFFSDDRLVRLDGDIAAGAGLRGPAQRQDVVVVVPEDYPPRGFFDAIRPGIFDERARRKRRENLSDAVPAEGEASAGEIAAATAREGAGDAETAAGSGTAGATVGSAGADVATASTAATASAGTGSALEPAGKTAGTDDKGFLKRLFGRLKRDGSGEAEPSPPRAPAAPAPDPDRDIEPEPPLRPQAETPAAASTAGTEPATEPASSAGATTGEADSAQAAPAQADPAQADPAQADDGFFRRLVTRFRKAREEAQASGSASTPTTSSPDPGPDAAQ